MKLLRSAQRVILTPLSQNKKNTSGDVAVMTVVKKCRMRWGGKKPGAPPLFKKNQFPRLGAQGPLDSKFFF